MLDIMRIKMLDAVIWVFLVGIVIWPIGMINPARITRRTDISRKQFGLVGSLILLMLMIVIGILAPETAEETTSNVATPTEMITEGVVEGAATEAPAHGGVRVKVTNVVDGDTIKIETGEVVRYIGIDTPETVAPNKPVQCFGKEASAKNNELVEGKTVELSKDVSEKDRYGRLLRYVWTGETMINEQLVKEGYARASTYPPDVKYQDRFLAAEKEAREKNAGLWGDVCRVTPTPTATKQPTIVPTTTARLTNTPAPTQPPQGGGGYVCDCSKTCGAMSSCAEAQFQLNNCGCGARDNDHDGIACDADCQ